MDYGELFGGLNALDVVRVVRDPAGNIIGTTVDSEPVPPISQDLVWDDLRFPASGINLFGIVTPPTLDVTTLFGTLLFDSATVNAVVGVAQLPHSWKPGTIVKPHIHWTKTTNDPGLPLFAFAYAIANAGEVFPAYSDAIANPGVPAVADDDTAQQSAIMKFSDIDMTGFRESCIILWGISRIGGDVGDTYPADARLLEFDIHYQLEKRGTIQEFPQ